VKQQDASAVRALLQKRVDVNAPAGDGATALHWAAYLDRADLVDLLLAAGANVNVANDLRITPLALAAANGNAAVIATLLRKGAAVNAASETGVTPLMEAARTGRVDAVRALLAGGADVNARETDRGQTALMWAVARRHPAVVKVLIEQRADVAARTRVRPLTVMLDQGPRRAVKTSMQDARQISAGGSTALHFAALAGDADSARLLLGAGADVNAAAADGNSALVLAAFSGHPAVAGVLIEAGADPNAAGAGYTALHAAALRGDLEWALPTPMTGATPLLVAATYLEVEIVRALLAGGADPAIALPNGTTPLLAAAGIAVEKETRPSDLVRWNIVDNDTPQVPRAEADVVAATTLLLEAGADVNQTTDTGDTALHAAAAAGMPAVIQLLADRGAALDVKNKNGQTPLALTVPRGRPGEGRAPVAPGLKAAEELLRRLGAQ
jgi:ankyrin repeat protein